MCDQISRSANAYSFFDVLRDLPDAFINEQQRFVLNEKRNRVGQNVVIDFI